MDAERQRTGIGASLAYAAIIAYGTLYPFVDWSPPPLHWLDLLPTWPAHIGRIDLLTNIIIYVPLGILLVWGLRSHWRGVGATLVAVAAGSSLSLGLELVQGLLPARSASLSDLAANGAGTLVGALLAGVLAPSMPAGSWLRSLQRQWARPNSAATMGLTVFAMWTLSQLSPFVPSADLGSLKEGLRPVWTTLLDMSRFDIQQMSFYALAICGLAVVGVSFVRKRSSHRPLLFVGVVYAVLLLKVPVLTRQLSLEALTGAMVGLFLYLVVRRSVPRSSVRLAGATVLIVAYASEGLRGFRATGYGQVEAMSWLPFGRYRLDLFDLADILGSAWIGLGMGYLVRLGVVRRKRVMAAWSGALLIGLVALAVEWTQRWLPERVPDVTNCLILLGAWTVPWLWSRSAAAARNGRPPTRSHVEPPH